MPDLPVDPASTRMGVPDSVRQALADRYAIERKFGRGGIGVVYLAREIHFSARLQQRRVLLGLALAYLGQKPEARRDGQRGVAMLPISQDGYFGPYNQLQLVGIYILIGEPEEALDQLEPLLRVPFYLSPGWLRIDPTFDPHRNNPRFRKLVEATI